MVLTRASKSMVTRSKDSRALNSQDSRALNSQDSLSELPKKRKASTRESKPKSKRPARFLSTDAHPHPSVTAPVTDPSRSLNRPPATTICNICLEEVPGKKTATISTCGHSFCKGCFKQLVRTSIKDKAYPIKCPEPDCSCQLDLEEDVRPVFVTKKERKEYAELLDVAAISCIEDKDRFYCPNQACSALYQFTNNKVPPRCKDVSRACHHCKQKFCMRCQVPWHDSLSCTAFQILPAEERSSTADVQAAEMVKQHWSCLCSHAMQRASIRPACKNCLTGPLPYRPSPSKCVHGLCSKVHALAKTENWKRCPSCRFFVERLEGCAFMACHCGCNFDYNTGQAYENGIGPAHLFAPEWVDDHLAMMAANLAQLDGLMTAAAAADAGHR